MPTNGFFYSGNTTIFQQFGDFVSIDLSDPTKPALGQSLFTNQGQPDGGDMTEFGGTLVNDQIAYVAGITPGGSNVTNNTGNLLVVNIADPKNMSLITSLTIPGTINLLDVAVHGNRALVIGTAGTESAIFNLNAPPGLRTISRSRSWTSPTRATRRSSARRSSRTSSSPMAKRARRPTW